MLLIRVNNHVLPTLINRASCVVTKPCNPLTGISRRSFSSLNTSCWRFSQRESGKKIDIQNYRIFEKISPKVSILDISPQSCIHTSAGHCSAFEDKNTKALTVWSNVKEVKRSPVPALALGLSGLIPFVASPLYMIGSGLYFAGIGTAQVAYGASILSFLGGVRWGFTLPEENPVQPDWVNLGYSVLPSLIAWTGLLLPEPLSLFTMMGGLLFAGFVDMAMYGYPPWFKGLRFVLTFVAILSLWTTFMCSLLLPRQKVDESS